MAELEAAELAREDLVKRLHLLEDPKDLAEICIALEDWYENIFKTRTLR